MLPALSQLCSLNSPFEDDVADYAAGGCRALEIWLTKLETYLAKHSIDDARRLLAKYEMTAPVASGQGGLLTSQGEARRAAWELFERRVDLCRGLGVGTLVVACDIAAPLAQIDLDRARMSLAEAAQFAGQHGLRVALEFQAQAAFGNNLQTAAALVAEAGSPHLGICFDAFHYYVGPSKFEDVSYLTAANLFHVQLCDLADTAREVATDADRILPGEGDIQLGPILDQFRAIGYNDHVSLELMNPRIWQISARTFGELGMRALQTALGKEYSSRSAEW
jgi:2-keto-myo-inositol isomerase